MGVIGVNVGGGFSELIGGGEETEGANVEARLGLDERLGLGLE